MLSRGEFLNRLIIVGSPRVDGRSAHLANALFESCIEECPDDELALAPVSTLDISGCVGCDACRENVARIAEAGEDDEVAPPCAIEDDMLELYELIDAADELTVVSPVYFAGPPSQLKALLDRLQPYYWSEARKQEKRPAVLHVVGEGGDPHGFDALISIVRSAVAVAGFKLETVYDWVGKIDEAGEIVAEASEIALGEDAAVACGAVGAQAAPEGESACATSAQNAVPAADIPEESASDQAEPGSSWGERGSARKRLSLDGAPAPKGKASSRRAPAAENRSGKGARPGSSARGGQGAKGQGRGGSSRKGSSKGGKRRG